MLSVIINFDFNVGKNCDIKDLFFRFYFLFNKIVVNKCKHNINYDFSNFKTVVDFIY